ncbi:coiled-coil domain-containing protein 187 [Python bivittatus]|uniref:Coiled-coil domain-containing protein 187 n=1 Tax=Python bivittatus TaxID=176946 RepID=A0A9F5IZ84_PYTBI|nr:coiled-coil domain-containing protein 187 [Python bivittatus]
MEKMKREGQAAEPNRKPQDWKNPGWIQKWSRRHQKAPDTEKGSENQPRSTGRARKAGPQRGSSDGLKTTCSPKIENASADARAMGTRESSRRCKGRSSGSPLRSDTSGKECQLTARLAEGRKKPYSPEQVREFMDQKAAERHRRIQEERRTSKKAHEERNKKLQEVYRKQREAVNRKGHCVKRLSEDVTCKHNLDSKYTGGPHPGRDDTEWVHRVSQALLRNESKFNSELDPRMAKTGQVTPMLGFCPSTGPEGQLRSPLKLKHLDISSPQK